MKVSHDWLKKYLSNLPQANELADLITFHAFEIEGVEEGEGDTIIDVDVLPNRAHDALSHRGIARELATLLNTPLQKDPFKKEVRPFPESNTVSVTVEAPELCRRYQAVVIKGVRIEESPQWLKDKLEVLGHRSINNIVDITNYVMLDLGQPLHAFDLENVGDEIVVRRAKEGEEIEALDGEKYALTPEMLLISNAEGSALGIAGIKGGMHSGVSEKTVDIVLEAASFDPTATRKTSQVLKLRTDASARFENDPSPELTEFALREAVELITDIAGGEVEGQTDVYTKKEENPEVEVSVMEIANVLGVEITISEIAAIFERLGFFFEEHDGVFRVRAPFERRDILIKEDVIEEVGRVYGYKKIIGKPLPELEKKPAVNKKFYYAEKIRDLLVAEGFSEILTPVFVEEGGDIKVLNPLASDKGHLRKELKPGVEKAMALNIQNAPLLGVDTVKLFEIGKIFTKNAEKTHLAIAVSKKKILPEILQKVSIELGISLSSNDSQFCETNLDALIKDLPVLEHYDSHEAPKDFQYEQIVPFPFALRDIAMWTPQGTNEAEVSELLKTEAGALLVNIQCFDRFEKDEKISYAFHLVFQSKEKTLSEEDINGVMSRVEKKVLDQGFEVR